MCIDFRRNPPTTVPTLINGMTLDVVRQYKYLGTILDDKLNFDTNTDYICKKANQRLFFLRKLKGFNVDRSLLKAFYSSFVESILTFAMICWFGNLSVINKNRLGKTVSICRKIIGIDLNSIEHTHKVRATQRAMAILANTTHPLHSEFCLLPSGRRYTYRKCARSNRYLKSFVPLAVGFLNKL